MFTAKKTNTYELVRVLARTSLVLYRGGGLSPFSSDRRGQYPRRARTPGADAGGRRQSGGQLSTLPANRARPSDANAGSSASNSRNLGHDRLRVGQGPRSAKRT